MGTSGSKPDWYPGEPSADSFNAPPCNCNFREDLLLPPTPEVGERPPDGGGRVRHNWERQREITSLPVVELKEMQFIANGAFCAVFACKYRGWNIVAKRVRQDLSLKNRKVALANLWVEYDCLRALSHPNVVDVYGMCRVSCHKGYEDWNELDVCLLLEQLAFGTVGDLMGTIIPTEKNLATSLAKSRRMKMVPFRCRLHRALELAQGLAYVHEGSGKNAMMHRDVKSVNVGFAQNGNLKLMDFGLSKVTPPGATDDETFKMTGEVGSFRYMAPELVKHEPYNAKVDIYSWAVLTWEMLTMNKPYASYNESTFVKKVVLGGDRPEIPKSWPGRLSELVAAAWHADYSKRPTASEVATALKAIYEELSPKERHRPSYTASAGSTPGSRGGGDAGTTSRRHSWAPSGSLSITRFSGSTSTSGNSANGTKEPLPAAKTSTPASAPPSSSGTQAMAGKSSSMPMPRSSTSERQRCSFTARKWLRIRGKSSPGPAPTGEGEEAPDCWVGDGSGTGAPPPHSSAQGHELPTFDSVVVGQFGKGDGQGEAVDGNGQDKAPMWTADGGAAVGVDGGSRSRCQLHTTGISLRKIIADALARETEGLSPKTKIVRMQRLGSAAGATAVAEKAEAGAGAGAQEGDNIPSQGSRDIGESEAGNHRATFVIGRDSFPGSGEGGAEEKENTLHSSSGSALEKSPLPTPAAQSDLATNGAALVPAPGENGVSRDVARKASISKLWPSQSFETRTRWVPASPKKPSHQMREGKHTTSLPIAPGVFLGTVTDKAVAVNDLEEATE